MFWRKKKKSGRPTDGPNLFADLPSGTWGEQARAFHANANQVVTVILSDDESTLDPLPVMQPQATGYTPNWVDRQDPETGARFRTDTEGENGYLIRSATVRLPVTDQERQEINALFSAWTAEHLPIGSVKRFVDEDGEQFYWRVGDDDVIGLRLEQLGPDIGLSAKRAWVLPMIRQAFAR
ncbi:MAG: hypothetical protein AAFU41_14990 [Pseudomonadota bacterium]